MTNTSSFHVVPSTGRWQIFRDGALFAQCQQKEYAVSLARKLAVRHGATLVVHPFPVTTDEMPDALRTA